MFPPSIVSDHNSTSYNGMNLQFFFYNPDLWWLNGWSRSTDSLSLSVVVWQEFWSTEDVEVVTRLGFNPEVGSVGMAVSYTIRATMSQEGWQILLFKQLPSGYTEEVPNPIWE
ncbi:mannosylglycoprotein endo-beta-mannosidase [Quercus suber]|uniref:Mannosylglycoprotein endo-beta-mannosidase n=1 Tax=Quercus suber TaxID=58331 RepID=A0AAW0KFP0_QUESU